MTAAASFGVAPAAATPFRASVDWLIVVLTIKFQVSAIQEFREP
jgi:hypothetical protein